MVALFTPKSAASARSGVFWHPKTGRYASSRPGFRVILPEQTRAMDETESKPLKRSAPINPAAVAAAAASTSAQRMDRPDPQQGPYAINNYRRRYTAERAAELTEGPAPVQTYEYEQIVVADQVDRPLRFQREEHREAWHTGRLRLADGREVAVSRRELSRDHFHKELAVNVIHLARQRTTRMAA
ncbi:MAG: hypothetical protein EYC62_07670 [Alphaproteobacteria bacterium]|nr:MAG: hypothetical protein EYC62_07670 [Alphaproteobacteria bacterium]